MRFSMTLFISSVSLKDSMKCVSPMWETPFPIIRQERLQSETTADIRLLYDLRDGSCAEYSTEGCWIALQQKTARRG